MGGPRDFRNLYQPDLRDVVRSGDVEKLKVELLQCSVLLRNLWKSFGLAKDFEVERENTI